MTAKKVGRDVAPMVAALTQAKNAKETLGRLDDSVTKLLRTIEKELGALDLGLPLEWVVESTFEQGLEFVGVLEFRKLSGKWRLTFTTGCAGEPESWTTCAVSDLKRNKRAFLLRHHVRHLVLAAGKRVLDNIAERQEAVAEGDSVMMALEKVKS